MRKTILGFLLFELIVGLMVFLISVLIIGSSLKGIYLYRKKTHDIRAQFAQAVQRLQEGSVDEAIPMVTFLESGPADFKLPPLLFQKVGMLYSFSAKRNV